MASYINTGFKSRNNSNKDLIDIFEPYFGPTPSFQTKYKSSQNGNLDLKDIFQLYTAGDLSANTTNFTTFNGTAKVDLKSVFRTKKTLPDFPVQVNSTSGFSIVSCCMYDKYAIIITSSYIYYSSDYGATYTLSISTLSNLLDCCIFGNYAIVIANKVVHYSSDFGKTWTLTTSGLPESGQNYKSCSICDNYACIANSLNGIYGSSNYGQEWVNLNAPNVNWNKVSISKTDTTGNYIAIASYDVGTSSSVPRMYYSSRFTGATDMSFNVSLTTFNVNIDSLSLSGDKGILCASGISGGIYYTTNGGQNWNKSSSGVLTDLVFCSLSNAIDASFNTTYVGIASGANNLYISKNGGQTWPIAINQNYFENCAISNSNVICYNKPPPTAGFNFMHYGKV